MSDMTAEARACLAEIEAVDQRAVVHGQRAIITIGHYLRAAAAQARAEERESCAEIALAIDSGRGNEKEIAAAIRDRSTD